MSMAIITHLIKPSMLLAQTVPGIACDANGNFNVSNPGQLLSRAAIIQRGNCTFAEKA